MPPGRPKKVPIEVIEPTHVDVPVHVKAPSELDVQLERQAQLLELRDRMTSEGIDSISKLDALLSQVNQRVKELS